MDTRNLVWLLFLWKDDKLYQNYNQVQRNNQRAESLRQRRVRHFRKKQRGDKEVLEILGHLTFLHVLFERTL